MKEETTFAQLNGKSVVTNVIAATPDYIKSLADSGNYVQAWIDADGEPSKRYNYPLIGFSYNKEANAFVPPCPGAGYELDTKTYRWVPTPTNISSQTLDIAALRLAKVTYLSVKTTNDMLTDESRAALTSYVAKISGIASTAQAAIAMGEAYQPVFPPEPTLNTNAPVLKGVGEPVVLQFKPDTVEQ